MKINALLINPADNVATCVAGIQKGEQAAYRSGSAICTLTASEDIPEWHKIALCSFSEGDPVIKYGEIIGKAIRPISKGSRVSHENIAGIPRDYESELLHPEKQ